MIFYGHAFQLVKVNDAVNVYLIFFLQRLWHIYGVTLNALQSLTSCNRLRVRRIPNLNFKLLLLSTLYIAKQRPNKMLSSIGPIACYKGLLFHTDKSGF